MARYRIHCLLLSALVFGVPTVSLRAGRYEDLTRRFSTGPKMVPQAATFFGGEGVEEFVAADALPDGSVVAFGNSAGPAFPDVPVPVVLGRGEHRGLDPMPPDRKGIRRFAPENPDLAGLIVRYAPGLEEVRGVTRFDWGVASISAGCASADGRALLIAGRCTERLRAFGSAVRVLEVPEPSPVGERRRASAARRGPYTFEGVTVPGDVFVARLSADASKLEWAWVLPGFRNPPDRIWRDRAGALYISARGLWRIPPDGGKPERINPVTDTPVARYQAVDPSDGSHYFGGDRNTHTGHQPYRRPFLYKYDAKGTKLWKLWEPNPKAVACGGDGNGLCSDSSVRGVEFAPDGDLLVAGWSDGGNSVFGRQPNDVSTSAGRGTLGLSPHGMKGANSLAYILRIELSSFTQPAWTHWMSFLPMNFVDVRRRGAPNHASIRAIRGLSDNSIAIVGEAATGMIQTPNAFAVHPTDGSKYGGEFVTVFTPGLDDVMFSSYLPGVEEAGVAAGRTGLLVFGRASGSDGRGNSTPAIRAVQSKVQGPLDAWIAWIVPPASAAAVPAIPVSAGAELTASHGYRWMQDRFREVE